MSGCISIDRTNIAGTTMLYDVSLDGKLVESCLTWEQVRLVLQELEADENAGD